MPEPSAVMPSAGDTRLHGVGIVIIGRNEGQRLLRCLASVPPGLPVVYVDSASVDGSAQAARAQGADVIELDMSIRFTAARARNAGFQRLMQISRPSAAQADAPPTLRYVQFIDGDCELIDGWLNAAAAALDAHGDWVCVNGRLRERHPEHSIYNRLCDAEWDGPAGQIEAVGGIAMMRVTAVAAVGGFREDLVAGEEPELCQRMRDAGGVIWRLDQAMAWHDAAMLRFAQWWLRSKRNGYGNAHGLAVLPQGSSERQRLHKRFVSAWVWGAALPFVQVLLGVWVGWPWGLLVLGLQPLQMWRVSRGLKGNASIRRARAFFLLLAKWPELLGIMQFYRTADIASRQQPSFDYKA